MSHIKQSQPIRDRVTRLPPRNAGRDSDTSFTESRSNVPEASDCRKASVKEVLWTRVPEDVDELDSDDSEEDEIQVVDDPDTKVFAPAFQAASDEQDEQELEETDDPAGSAASDSEDARSEQSYPSKHQADQPQHPHAILVEDDRQSEATLSSPAPSPSRSSSLDPVAQHPPSDQQAAPVAGRVGHKDSPEAADIPGEHEAGEDDTMHAVDEEEATEQPGADHARPAPSRLPTRRNNTTVPSLIRGLLTRANLAIDNYEQQSKQLEAGRKKAVASDTRIARLEYELKAEPLKSDLACRNTQRARRREVARDVECVKLQAQEIQRQEEIAALGEEKMTLQREKTKAQAERSKQCAGKAKLQAEVKRLQRDVKEADRIDSLAVMEEGRNPQA